MKREVIICFLVLSLVLLLNPSCKKEDQGLPIVFFNPEVELVPLWTYPNYNYAKFNIIVHLNPESPTGQTVPSDYMTTFCTVNPSWEKYYYHNSSENGGFWLYSLDLSTNYVNSSWATMNVINSVLEYTIDRSGYNTYYSNDCADCFGSGERVWIAVNGNLRVDFQGTIFVYDFYSFFEYLFE